MEEETEDQCRECQGELDEHTIYTKEGHPICGKCLSGYLTGMSDAGINEDLGDD